MATPELVLKSASFFFLVLVFLSSFLEEDEDFSAEEEAGALVSEDAAAETSLEALASSVEEAAAAAAMKIERVVRNFIYKIIGSWQSQCIYRAAKEAMRGLTQPAVYGTTFTDRGMAGA